MSSRKPPATAALRAALAALLLVAQAGGALAEAPTGAQIERLSARLERANSVRLRTPEGEWVERRVTLGPEGVGLPGAARYGANSVRPAQPGLVPWERVAGLDTRGGGGNRGLAYGAIAGAVLALALTNGPRDEQSLGGSSAALPLYLLCGAAAGAGLGAAVGAASDRWTPAWPEGR